MVFKLGSVLAMYEIFFFAFKTEPNIPRIFWFSRSLDLMQSWIISFQIPSLHFLILSFGAVDGNLA